MLAAIESTFLAALSAALPSSVTLRAGPSAGPSVGTSQLVELSAEKLAPAAPSGDDLAAGRGPSFVAERHVFQGDGATRDFALPEGMSGVIAEVESPPGRTAPRGDEYDIDERTVRFYEPPPSGDVVVVVRGPRARGFVEKRLADIHLILRVFGEGNDVDALFSKALAAILVSSIEPRNIEAAMPLASGVRMRLLRPTLSLGLVTRSRVTVDDAAFQCAAAELQMRGELELSIALGEAEPASRIEHVEIGPPRV